MNKYCYRIIFNRQKNRLEVVSEIAKTQGKTISSSVASLTNSVTRSIIVTMRPLTLMTGLGMGVMAITVPVNAKIVADASAPGRQQPEIKQSSNGTTQVNIQAPSKGGVSHNKYSQFDVDQKGVILNNSRNNINTQLGGYVAGNNNLAAGEAKIILNEVNSRDPSQLNGFIEVAGAKAQVVIANASGITCDGCGFINANKATLTTGNAIVESGNLKGYRVEKGKIKIAGKGLDTSRTDYTELIARSVEVNAGIWGNDVNVVAGRNSVSADLNIVSAYSEDDSAKPSLAVDVSHLGGMYAGKIHLIGTEKGVGVSNAGQLGASTGSVVITADGKIVNNGSIQAQNNITLSSRQNVENAKRLYAKGDIGIQTKADVINQGTMIAANSVSIKGRRVNNTQSSTIAAGVDDSGKLTDKGSLTVNAHTALLNGQQLASQEMSIYASEGLDTEGATLNALSNMTVETGFWHNQNANVVADGALTVRADDMTNTGASILADGLSIKAESLTGDGKLLSKGDLSLTLNSTFTNREAVLANGSLTLIARGDIINYDKIIAAAISLNSQSLVNHDRAEVSGNVMHLLHDKSVMNTGIIDGGDLTIKTDALDNIGTGRIYGDRITLRSHTINNLADASGERSAVIAARDSLDIGVHTLNNKTHSQIISLGALTLGGDLDEAGRAAGQATVVNNHSARLESGGDMQLNVDTLNNINDDLRTELVKVGEQYFSKYCHIGSTTCYAESEVRFQRTTGKRKNFLRLITPDGKSHYNYNGYKYTETYYQTQITHSDPGQIISGGNMIVNGKTVNNEDSQILAGNTLLINAALNNVATQGIEKTVTYGTYTYYYRKKDKNDGGKSNYYGKSESSVYKPADRVTVIDLQAAKIEQHQALNAPVMDDRPAQDKVDNTSTIQPNTTLPESSLYQINRDPESGYLVETDGRFTDYKKWLGSDYMIKHMKSDPNNVMKRLGDGYYEQQLIKEQISGLTGQRYLGQYRDDTAQYKALMDAGIEYAEKFELVLGVALTEAQMRQLTTDIVWLVGKTVTLADGTTQEVLVPQVYIVNRPWVTTGGALLSGQNIQVKTEGDIHNSGTLVAKDKLILSANDIGNSGALSANTVAIQAMNDINHSGIVSGEALVSLQARNNVNIASNTHTEIDGANEKTVVSRVATVYSKDGDIQISAENEVNLTAALVANHNKAGSTLIHAGNDINLNTVTTRDKESNVINSDNYRHTDVQKAVGTEIQAAGDITLQAGNSLNAQAALVNSDKHLTLKAKDIVITSAEERNRLDAKNKYTSSGTLSKMTEETVIKLDDSLQKSSEFLGNRVTILADNDLTIKGSQVIGTDDVVIKAGNDVNIEAAKESLYSYQNTVTTKSGLMSSGGIGFSVGKMTEDMKQTDTETRYLGSTVGSTEGSVTIQAGKDVAVKASDVIAGRDIAVQADNISVEALDATTHYQEQYKKQQTGLTLAITGTASDVYEAVQAVKRAKDGGNSKLVALQSIKAGLTVIEAIQDMGLENSKGESQASIGVSIMGGTQITEREVNQEQHSVVGSGISAGNNVTLVARGDQDGNGGDITLKGSEVKAANDITLEANRDLNLTAALNTQHSDSDEKSYGGQVGIGFAIGGDESGFRFKGNANFSRERENADGSAWSESIVDAGNKLTITTGKDANLIGGQLKGDRIEANIGNNLNIQSLQDTDNYEYEKISLSVSGSGGTGASANLSLSATEMESNWASVTDQSGIFAGKGGYDIYVGNNTDLKGAVIASEAEDSANNRLDTGTLSFSDIKNKADYSVSHVSVSVGTSGGPTPPTLYQDSDKDSSTTYSAVEQGELTIRNKEAQKQNINALSRDTDNANNVLGEIFNKQEHLDNIEAVGLVNEITQKAINVKKNSDRLKAKQALDANNGPTEQDKLAAKLQLEEERKGKADAAAPTDKEINDLAYYNATTAIYERDFKTTGIGSETNKAITAVGSVITGILTGNIAGGLAGGSAPYVANELKALERDNPEAHKIAHGILGAVVAELQGGSALAGGVGAATGEIAAEKIYEHFYGNTAKDKLTEADKQTISDLASLAAGLASGVAGSSSAAEVVSAINASKNAVENNAMAQWNAGDIMGLHPDTAKAYASIASADNMTNEEKLQSFEELTKGINMYDPAREYIEQWVKTPQYVALVMGGAYAEAAALVGMIESAVKNNGAPSIDDVGMIQLYNKLQVGSFISNVTNAGKGGTGTNNNSSLKVGETKIVNEVSVTRVGRWMSPDELAQMQSTGKIVQGGGGQTFISTNGVNDFKGAAPKGSVYVEFDVPSNSLIQGGKDGWYKMLGNDAKPSQKYQLDKQGGSLIPNVSNINILDKK